MRALERRWDAPGQKGVHIDQTTIMINLLNISQAGAKKLLGWQPKDDLTEAMIMPKPAQ